MKCLCLHGLHDANIRIEPKNYTRYRNFGCYASPILENLLKSNVTVNILNIILFRLILFGWFFFLHTLFAFSLLLLFSHPLLFCFLFYFLAALCYFTLPTLFCSCSLTSCSRFSCYSPLFCLGALL